MNRMRWTRFMCSFSLPIQDHPINNRDGGSISKKTFTLIKGSKHAITFARAIYRVAKLSARRFIW